MDILTTEGIHLYCNQTMILKIPILTNVRAGPGMSGPGREARVARGRGSRVADFARGRGSRGAGRRPPATLPTLALRPLPGSGQCQY